MNGNPMKWFLLAWSIIVLLSVLILMGCRTDREGRAVAVSNGGSGITATADRWSLAELYDSMARRCCVSIDSIVVRYADVMPSMDDDSCYGRKQTCSKTAWAGAARGKKGLASATVYGITATSEASRGSSAREVLATTDSLSRFSHSSDSSFVHSEARHAPLVSRSYRRLWFLPVLAFVLILLWQRTKG